MTFGFGALLLGQLLRGRSARTSLSRSFKRCRQKGDALSAQGVARTKTTPQSNMDRRLHLVSRKRYGAEARADGIIDRVRDRRRHDGG